MPLESTQILASLKSDCCPGCGKPKKPHRSVCYPCWRKLDKATSQALYNGFGVGYEPAFDAAMKALGVTADQLKERIPS